MLCDVLKKRGETTKQNKKNKIKKNLLTALILCFEKRDFSALPTTCIWEIWRNIRNVQPVSMHQKKMLIINAAFIFLINWHFRKEDSLRRTQIELAISYYSNGNDSAEEFIHQLWKTQDKAECNPACCLQRSRSESLHFVPATVCANTSASVLPWNAALVEELASAGEELLERELKGDCLKHSSRNGLQGHTWWQELHRQLVTLTHSLTRCKLSCWLRHIIKREAISRGSTSRRLLCIRLTCLFPPCYCPCGCWICWLFLKKKDKKNKQQLCELVYLSQQY